MTLPKLDNLTAVADVFGDKAVPLSMLLDTLDKYLPEFEWLIRSNRQEDKQLGAYFANFRPKQKETRYEVLCYKYGITPERALRASVSAVLAEYIPRVMKAATPTERKASGVAIINEEQAEAFEVGSFHTGVKYIAKGVKYIEGVKYIAKLTSQEDEAVLYALAPGEGLTSRIEEAHRWDSEEKLRTAYFEQWENTAFSFKWSVEEVVALIRFDEPLSDNPLCRDYYPFLEQALGGDITVKPGVVKSDNSWDVV